MRVMITGGRHYGSKVDGPFMARDPEARAFLSVMLDDLHRNSPISTLIVGDASGADFLAYRWANERNVPVERYRADWRAHGKSAGPIRNAEMIRTGRPNLVVAFKGSDGTADAVNQARKAKIEVLDFT